jgi:hypothetical protein
LLAAEIAVMLKEVVWLAAMPIIGSVNWIDRTISFVVCLQRTQDVYDIHLH